MSRKYDISKVFNDLLSMSICAFHRTNIQSQLQEKDEVNESLYFEAINNYSKDDLESLGKAMGILQLNVLENPYSDILGEYFTIYITNGQNGQYFTPIPVCDFIAATNLGNGQSEGNRMLDPACGSGRMLLSAAKRNHRNYFFGADNSNTCAKMAVLNFFLNGLKGEVAWMNSLSMEWHGGWHINTKGIGIIPIEKEQSQIWSEAPKIANPKPIEKVKSRAGEPAHQLTLF
ncbi:MAG: SAM-dependent DNA methyltransferase [Cyclobacteriaceae bacterium]